MRSLTIYFEGTNKPLILTSAAHGWAFEDGCITVWKHPVDPNKVFKKQGIPLHRVSKWLFATDEMGEENES